MDTVNKKQAIKIIKESTNFQATIEYIQNSFTMNTKGDLMPKQEEQISLKSIYELMIAKFDLIDKRFDLIETEIKDMKTEIKDIKDDIKNIKVDINRLKHLPTILNELKNL